MKLGHVKNNKPAISTRTIDLQYRRPIYINILNDTKISNKFKKNYSSIKMRYENIGYLS